MRFLFGGIQFFPSWKELLFLYLYFYVYFLSVQTGLMLCIVWWSCWFRELWTNIDEKVKSHALAKRRKGWWWIAEDDCHWQCRLLVAQKQKAFCLFCVTFCFFTGKLLISVDLHLKTLGGTDWEVCLTWGWRLNSRLPLQFSCDFHAAKYYLMLLNRNHRFSSFRSVVWHAELVGNGIKLSKQIMNLL